MYVARVKDLQADAEDFARFAKLVFSFANLVAERTQENARNDTSRYPATLGFKKPLPE